MCYSWQKQDSETSLYTLRSISFQFTLHVPVRNKAFTQHRIGEGNGTPLQYSCLENPMDGGAWWAAVHGVVKSRTWLSDFTFTFHFPALEKEMATHSSVLAWRIPGMGEPGGLLSMGLHRVGHDWSDLAVATLKLWTKISPTFLPIHLVISMLRCWCVTVLSKFHSDFNILRSQL